MESLQELFVHPTWLLGIVMIPALGYWMVCVRRLRDRDLERLGASESRGSVRDWALMLACLLLIVALARPRWGRDPDSDLPPGHDVVIALDVSLSMAAEDALPDRLGAAVASAERLVRALGVEPGERVGIVAFAGRAVVRCPLTTNLGAAIDAMDALSPGSVKPGGSDLGAALRVAAGLLDDERAEPAGGRVILLLSDGEDHEGTWTLELPRLRALGIIVHAVAFGDPVEAHPIPIRPGLRETSANLIREGQVVRTRRRDDDLKAIAESTGGVFLPVGLQATDLGRLYRERISPAERRQRRSMRPPETRERFPWFLAGTLGFVVLSWWPGRPSGRILSALVLGVLVAADGPNPPTNPPSQVKGFARDAFARGEAAFARGDYPAALAAFEGARDLVSDSPLPHHNIAATLFRLGRYEEAGASYRDALERDDGRLAPVLNYALGNVEVALGKFREALIHYDACLASQGGGARLDSIREDAAINREFALSRLPPASSEPEEEDSGSGSPDEENPNRPANERDGPSRPQDGQRDVEGNTGTSGASRVGGAGGAGGSTPEGLQAASRLAEAVDRIRQARQRPNTDPGSSDPASHRIDW